MTIKYTENYKNPSLPVEERVLDLLKKMTLEEKVAQTISVGSNNLIPLENDSLFQTGKIKNDLLKELLVHGIGSLQLPGKNLSPKKSAQYRNALQKYIIDNTRLGIPAFSQEECLNGHLAKGSTMFPRPIGLAGSFDTELVEEIYSTIGVETRSRGGHQAFTPVLDIGRDPRWGRIEETYGEDTYLVSRMGVAAVKGLQGGNKGVTSDHIISSPKHFAGYAQCSGGRNFAPTEIPLRMLRNEILPPFKSAVMEAGALGIMPSHSDIDGIPSHGNKWLLTEVLRNEWGFKGIVVSDYNDSERLSILHNVAQNRELAAIKSIDAGLDMDIPTGSAYVYLLEAARKDKKVENLIDRSVSRILRIKFKMGLFEDPFVDPDHADSVVNCENHKKVAKKASDKTVILLKNENNLLPLNRKNIKKIAVIGPNADPVEFSYYSERPNIGASILDGIRTKAGNDFEVLYEKGCNITKNMKVMETELEITDGNPRLYTLKEEADTIFKAMQAAKKADIAVVCIGGSPNSSREAATLGNHYGDNANLDLVGQQNELVKAILETGTPTIVVLINGKPLSCGYVYENVPAVLEGWYLGQETGNAIADILFGDVNPGGKLPVTISRSVGHLPAYYSQKPTGFLKGYLFTENAPYFPFGYGLSYTTFSYENLKLSNETILMGENVEVFIDITNTGSCKGDEVVQMYIRDRVASITRPSKELKDFKRITLKPGETRHITFVITPDKLSFIGVDYTTVIEPGEFEVMVGTNSVTYSTVVLTVM